MSVLTEQMFHSTAQRKFCKLNIKLSPELPEEVRNLYVNSIQKHNNNTFKVIFGHERGGLQPVPFENLTFDSGFDLFNPFAISDYSHLNNGEVIKIDHKIQTSMYLINPKYNMGVDINHAVGVPVGYYLYPRSSTGTKTPFRLANSVGIIDSGYRGNIIAAFDIVSKTPGTIDVGQRLTQICPPSLEYPLWIVLVDELDDTERGAGGFGSTGV